LLALYPAAPDTVEIQCPETCSTGDEVKVHVRVLANGKPMPAHLPLSIQVSDPDGRANHEYSHFALAQEGKHDFRLRFALNDVPGIWCVNAKELSTGLEDSLELRVAAAQ